METNTDIGSMEVATRSGISTNTLNDNFLKMTRETTSTTLRRSRPSHTWAKIYSCLNTHTRGGELPVSFSHGHVLMQCTRRRGRHRLASHFLPLSLPQGGKDAWTKAAGDPSFVRTFTILEIMQHHFIFGLSDSEAMHNLFHGKEKCIFELKS